MWSISGLRLTIWSTRCFMQVRRAVSSKRSSNKVPFWRLGKQILASYSFDSSITGDNFACHNEEEGRARKEHDNLIEISINELRAKLCGQGKNTEGPSKMLVGQLGVKTSKQPGRFEAAMGRCNPYYLYQSGSIALCRRVVYTQKGTDTVSCQ